MKKLFLLLLVLFTTKIFANELSWVDEQIEAIKPPREGIENKEILKLKDPFVYLHPKKVKKVQPTTVSKKHTRRVTRKIRTYSRKFKLEAILNKSALINGKWYKEGSKVHEYTLQKVNRNSIILTRGKHLLRLTTRSRDKALKINNK